jgi:hypothetical protein
MFHRLALSKGRAAGTPCGTVGGGIEVVGTEVVGTDVVGGDVGGTDVVGADVVGADVDVAGIDTLGVTTGSGAEVDGPDVLVDAPPGCADVGAPDAPREPA